MYYCIDERAAVYSSIFFADDIDRRRKKSIINPIVVMKYLLFIALHVCGLFQNKSTSNTKLAQKINPEFAPPWLLVALSYISKACEPYFGYE